MPIVEDLNQEIAKLHADAFLTIEEHKKKGYYFWLQPVKEVLPNGHVWVEGRGEMIMLGSYSYLGLNQHPRINQAAKEAIEKYGTGTHGSRLLTGTLDIHERLEKKIAEFKGTESAVMFSTGYVANVATITSLMGKEDVVICDKMNHASILDGCVYSGAKFVRYLHNDMRSLENRLKEFSSARRRLVVVDAVFSMEGDIANLPEIAYLCKKYSASLMVDEAHSLGVLGATGRGIEEYFVMPSDTIEIKMGTLSKTIPSSGGYIAGSGILCTYLKHAARGFVYSGAPSAVAAAAALAGFEVIEQEPERVQRLWDNAEYFKKLLREEGFDLGNTQTPIVPIMCGETEAAANLAKFAQDHGIFIHAIYYPTVPQGKARLRASVLASHTKEDLAYCVKVLAQGAREYGVLK